MKNFLKMKINDFGSIKSAEIDLKKINVIAGINGSGKSTSSKLLYSFLESNSNEGYYLANSSLQSRFMTLILYWHHKLSMDKSDDENIDGLLTLIDSIDFNDFSFIENLKKRIKLTYDLIEKMDFSQKEEFKEELKEIEEVCELYHDGDRRYYNISNIILNSEFDFSKMPNYNDANVELIGDINDCEFHHKIDFNKSKIGSDVIKGNSNCLNFEDIIYIDSLSIFELDHVLHKSYHPEIPYHLGKLTKLVTSRKNHLDVFDGEFNDKVDCILRDFKKIIGGEVYYNGKDHEIKLKKKNNEHPLKNTASGVKQLGILQILLENRHLNENSFLIIDEPEINLHPEWQIRFAELLVKMCIDLNMHMYINSHSPQFIEALEVFSAKHNLVNDSKFYLSKQSEGDYFSFNEIKRKDLYLLYKNLGDAYDEIDEIRMENAMNGIKE